MEGTSLLNFYKRVVLYVGWAGDPSHLPKKITGFLGNSEPFLQYVVVLDAVLWSVFNLSRAVCSGIQFLLYFVTHNNCTATKIRVRALADEKDPSPFYYYYSQLEEKITYSSFIRIKFCCSRIVTVVEKAKIHIIFLLL